MLIETKSNNTDIEKNRRSHTKDNIMIDGHAHTPTII